MSYIVEFPPLQINANVFQYFCRDYLVVLKNISLCNMGDNDLYSKNHHTGYIVTFSPENWLYGSILMDTWLYSCLSPGQLAI